MRIGSTFLFMTFQISRKHYSLERKMWTRFVTILIIAHTIQAFSLKNNEDKKWEPLKELITGWEFTKNFSVSIGDASGNLFTRKFIFFKAYKIQNTN